MKKIQSELVEDGMILAREVCGPSGNILVNKGSTLSAALGRRLANWGIPSVFIEGVEEIAEAEAAAGPTPEELKSQVMNKFSRCAENPLMKKILVAAYQFRLQFRNE